MQKIQYREAESRFIVIARSSENLYRKMNQNTHVEMSAKQLRIYYVVELFSHTNLLNRILCVPSTWIRWQSVECEVVLVAYPDEQWEVTEERAKIYEDPGENWSMYLAQVKGSSDSFVNLIRHVNEEDRRVAGPSGSEVIATKCRSPRQALPPIATLSSWMNESSAYLLEYLRWFYPSPGFVDPNRSTINDVYEIIKEKQQSAVVKSLTSQSDHDDNIDKIFWELWISYEKMNQNLTSSEVFTGLEQEVNDLGGFGYSFPKNWTLKHCQYSPELVELINNTGVYIEKTELKHCLALSTKCTQLARLLTEHIFSESALRNCKYVGKVIIKSHLRLDTHATAVISSFVLTYGHKRGWNPSSDRAVKNAMRYMLAEYKKHH